MFRVGPFLTSALATAPPSGSQRLLYQHLYHAGSYADVVKHSILILLLQHMLKKPKPFCYVETHAGAGDYSLGSSEAMKLKEFKNGIEFLHQKSDGDSVLPNSVQRLMDMTADLTRETNNRNSDGSSCLVYPGSVKIALDMCREQDSIILCEKEKDQFDVLQSKVPKASGRLQLLHANGYRAMSNHTNIRSDQRALMFVDPTYQFGAETQQIVRLIKSLSKHWSAARMAIWHPVSSITREAVDRMYDEVAATGVEAMATELYGVNGSVGTGMLLIKPPYRIDDDLRQLLPEMAKLLRPEDSTEDPQSWLVERL